MRSHGVQALDVSHHLVVVVEDRAQFHVHMLGAARRVMDVQTRSGPRVSNALRIGQCSPAWSHGTS
jgi:hypothetical protein